MGKSKRNRKKNQKAFQLSAVMIEGSPERTPDALVEAPALNKANRALIILVLLVTLLAAYKLLNVSNGNIKTTSGPPLSSDNSSIKTGGSQPLAPSGSVDLQPTGNAAQAGSIQ